MWGRTTANTGRLINLNSQLNILTCGSTTANTGRLINLISQQSIF